MKLPPGKLLFLFWLGACMAAGGAAALRDGKGEIPADLFIEVKPVSREDNATLWWRRAAKELQKADGDVADAIRFVFRPAAKRPDSEQLDLIRHWINRNQQAFDLFRRGNEKPFAQWSERDPHEMQPELGIRPFVLGALFEADQLMDEGKFDEAIGRLLETLRITQRAIDGDGALIHYIVGSALRSFVHGAILRGVRRPDLPSRSLSELLKHVPRLDSETNSFSRVLCVEFTYYSYRDADVDRLVKDWRPINETDLALSLWPEELRRPFKILLDPGLVPLHPKPWDQKETTRWNAHAYRTYRTNALSRWKERMDLEEEKNSFVQQLTDDIEPLLEVTEDEPLPLSRQAIQKAREAYLKIENPIGRIFHCNSGGLVGSDLRVFRSRTEREAVRAILALLIFERETGALPTRLEELIDEKILQQVPWDYFADAPLGYSRERHLVWSVGEDSVDDGGGGIEESSVWAGDDAVWSVPSRRK